MKSIILTLALASAFVSPAIAATFTGCYSSASSSGSSPVSGAYKITGTAATSLTTSDACSSACQGISSSFTYSYFLPGTTAGTCYCSTSSATSATYKASKTGDGSATCDSSLFIGAKISTTFSFYQCAKSSSSIADLSGSNNLVGLDSCWGTCESNQVLVIIPQLSGYSTGFQCKCGTSITSVSSSKCDNGKYQIYKHSDAGYASQLPRKRLRERLEQEALLKHAHCPNGLTPCNVEGAPDAFECIDTSTELESCGGCMYGAYNNATAPAGVDCSTLAGVPLGASTCTRGQCEVFTCDKGYELIGGECI
ncbi:hypothetical protein EHS25_006722 [Saitozyma podzolica]|uniref:Protein CPL1-like domain-containing protein n=1 Tax=Saitozyma podzolica TaxID=1890683 RepID=A0A427YSE3_9TREE|nr:hypothetical protein EHS25_006722 [Saitozyma podzolica]